MPWIVCEVCKEEEFRTAKSPCSYCAGTVSRADEEIQELIPGGNPVPVKENSKIVNRVPRAKAPATLDDVVAAQNRTTHAIRAFVRFLFIQLSATTFAYFIYAQGDSKASSRECVQYGSCNTAIIFYIAAALIWIIGVIISSNVGWSELAKSDVPD